MAGYSARQSTYTTGDVIAAADTNDEFNQLLAAFNASTGHTHDGTAGDGGPVSVLRDSNTYNQIILDATNNHLEFYVNVSSSSVQQLRIQDGAIVPITTNDIDLGTSSLEFKDAFFDGTVTTDAASILSLSLTSGATVTAINDEDNMSSDSATALATQQSIKAYVDSQVGASDTLAEILANGNTTGGTNIDVDDDDRIRVGANPDLEIYHDSTSNQSRIFAAGGGDLRIAGANVRLSGIAGTETMLHGTANGAVDIYYDNSVKLSTTNTGVTITGDLTVSGDDITMGTNTDTAIMVADGTNFNPVVPSGDVTLTNAGVFGIASGVIVNADINSSAAIADSKLDTISTAGKVDIGALEIDGATDIGADLADADLLIVDDGANGTERKAAMSRVQTYIESKISGDITISSGTAAIGAGVIVNADINASAAIADSKLATISTADKVSGAAVQIDGATDGTAITIADSDKFLIDDGGTTKYVNASQINAYTSAAVALDDISTGDAAATLATSAGNITIDAQGSDTDIIFKGTDGGVDTTFLTIDGSEAGAATFNNKIVATELDISGDIDVDGTTNLDVVDIDGAVDMASTLQVDGAITSSSGATITIADNTHALELISTDADANVGPRLALTRNSASPADNDLLGDIRFLSEDDTSLQIEYAKIAAVALDVSNGSTDTELRFDIRHAGSVNRALTLTPTEVVVNDLSFDTDFRVETNNQSSAFFIDAGNGSFNFNIPGTITVDNNSDTLTLKSTDADANAGPILVLTRDSSSPADDDIIGRIIFRGDDDGANITPFFTVDTRIADATNGSEDFKTVFSGVVAGTERHVLTLGSTEAVLNDGSQDIDFRVESNGNTHGLFVDAGNDRVGILNSSPSTALDVTGTVTATAFSGDGSALTNINAASVGKAIAMAIVFG